MQRFRYIGESVHYHGEGKHKRTLTKGQTIDSETDLVNVYPGVFELVGEVTRAQMPATVSAGGGSSPFAEDGEEEASTKAVPKGTNVTEQFPEAQLSGLQVYRVAANLYNVIDPARPEAPVNPKPVTKAKLSGYI